MLGIGFFAASASGGGAGVPAYEHIATAYGASASTISFSSIPQTYKHLQIRAVAVSTRSDSQSSGFKIRFNGDSTSTYNTHYLEGFNAGGSLSSGSWTDTTGLWGAYINTIYNSGTNLTAPSIIDILDYRGTKNKTTRNFSGVIRPDAYDRVTFSSGLWPSTAAITSISIHESVGEGFVSTSRFSLYGIKG